MVLRDCCIYYEPHLFPKFYVLFFFLFTEVILCFHSRGQHLCKFIGTKESVYIRKEFNSHRTGLAAMTSCENTQLLLLPVLQQYSYQLNYDTTAEINHSLHNYLFSLLLIKAVVVDGFSAVVVSNYPWFKPFTTVFSCGCFLCFYSG